MDNENGISFLKVFLIGMGFYVLFNAVFMMIMFLVAVYAMNVGITMSQVFSNIAGDPLGTIAVIFSPGGPLLSPPVSTEGYILALAGASSSSSLPFNGTSLEAVLLLWTFVPGLGAAILAGLLGGKGNGKMAFVGILVAVIVITFIPALFQFNMANINYNTSMLIFANSMYYEFTNSSITTGSLTPLELTCIISLVEGVFSGLIWAGIAGVSAKTSKY